MKVTNQIPLSFPAAKDEVVLPRDVVEAVLEELAILILQIQKAEEATDHESRTNEPGKEVADDLQS